MKSFSLREIAGVAGAELAGPGDLVLSGIASLSDAGPGDLTFVAGPRNLAEAGKSRAGAFLVSRREHAGERPALLHPLPALAFARIAGYLFPEASPEPGISVHAHVSLQASVGEGASISPGAVVERNAVLGKRIVLGANSFIGEGASLGDDCRLSAGAVVEAGCRVGARCRIGPGAVVGFDGFGYVWDGREHVRVPQVGIVVLEDDVDVGANACIDRAAIKETRIGRGSKIDNLAQIGHNAVVGENAIVCGQVGIAGSARIGKGAVLAGQAGIADHMIVGDGATVTAQAGVMRKVEPGVVVSGMPAELHADFLRREAAADRLPELFDRVRELELKLAKLERKD